MQQAISSIFHPRDSVYASLDNDTTDTPLELEHQGGEGGGTDEDPFSPISPAIVPSKTRTSRGGVGGTRTGTASVGSSLSPPRRTSGLGQHATTNIMGTSQSPFHAEPIDSTSIYQSHSPPSSSRAHSKRPTSTQSTMFGSGIGIGNRSLMGLLGGTRYDNFEDSGGIRVGAGHGHGVGAVLEEEDNEDGGGGMRIDESTLPPPPSALSTSSLSSSSDRSSSPPPDFTSQTRSRSGHILLPASPSNRKRPSVGILGVQGGMNAKERALWRWVNVEDLDGFLQEVYTYYVGKGIWAIGLSRLLNLLTVGWVICFSTFLIGCIDYSLLWDSHNLSEVVVPQCVSRFSGLSLLLVLLFGSFYFWRVVSFGLGVKKLWMMHEFYGQLLGVPENDIQTIPWHSIVTLISELRSTHPATSLSSSSHPHNPQSNLDAHDVANRIMREENYLVALFNKDLVDISIPIPVFLKRLGVKDGWGKEMLTRTLEWNLGFCLTGFLFGRDGQVRKAFVSERNRVELVEALKRRLVLMALINAVLAPFIVLYLMMWSFFRYFEEYHKNPSSIGSRGFTQLARWKFREFNELPHLFQQRLNRAHPLAESYVNQFPKEKTALISNFVAFLAGSFAAVLILFSLIDPDAFLHFEITKGRTVLFYIGVTGTVLAVARGMVPDENKVVEPEELMRDIVEYTHYLPVEWRGKLHSAEVHTEFGLLFPMKVTLFLQELLSVLITPFVLYFTLPQCAPQIVDFFREFTVHVDGLGYVCSFAVFDFKRHGDMRFGAPVEGGNGNERWKSKEGKMEKSFLGFATQNPAWVPRDQTQSLFLSKMTEDPQPQPHSHLHPTQPPRSNSRSNRFGRFQPHPVAEEKARMYDRAYQSSVGVRNRKKDERVIDEESGLDGESYIASMRERAEERDSHNVQESAQPESDGITGLLGEMYETSRRW